MPSDSCHCGHVLEMTSEKTTPAKKWLVRSRAWIGILILVPFAIGESFFPPLVSEESVGDYLLDFVAWVTFFVERVSVGGQRSTLAVARTPA